MEISEKTELPLVEQILSVYYNGVYFSSQDMQDIAKNLGFSYDAKGRVFILKHLVRQVEESKKESEFFKELSNVVQRRVAVYKELKDSYPSSSLALDKLINRSRAFTLFLQRNLIKGN